MLCQDGWLLHNSFWNVMEVLARTPCTGVSPSHPCSHLFERSSRALVVTEDWDVQIYAALCLINPGAVHLNVSAMSISNMQVSEYPAEQHPKED